MPVYLEVSDHLTYVQAETQVESADDNESVQVGVQENNIQQMEPSNNTTELVGGNFFKVGHASVMIPPEPRPSEFGFDLADSPLE